MTTTIKFCSLSACCAAAIACNDVATTETLSVESNALGVENIEIERTADDGESRLFVRGLRPGGEEIITLEIRNGLVEQWSYDETFATLVPGREIVLELDSRIAADNYAQKVSPANPDAPMADPVMVRDAMVPFVHLAAVRREAEREGVRFVARGGATDEVAYAWTANSCDSDWSVWSTTALNNINGTAGSDATCAFTWLDGYLFDQLACHNVPVANTLRYTNMSNVACSNDYQGTDLACGTNSPNGQCIYGPCNRQAGGGSQLATHDKWSANPQNCSIGHAGSVTNWTFYSGGIPFHSANGASSVNALKASIAGCGYNQCCWSSLSNRACRYSGASCPAPSSISC